MKTQPVHLFVSFVITLLSAAGCGSGKEGFACDSSEECAEGLSCSGVSISSCTGSSDASSQQDICTTGCESDADCEEFGLVCNRIDRCGAPNKCGQPD